MYTHSEVALSWAVASSLLEAPPGPGLQLDTTSTEFRWACRQAPNAATRQESHWRLKSPPRGLWISFRQLRTGERGYFPVCFRVYFTKCNYLSYFNSCVLIHFPQKNYEYPYKMSYYRVKQKQIFAIILKIGSLRPIIKFFGMYANKKSFLWWVEAFPIRILT